MERLTERYVPNDEKNGISGIKVFESENKIPLVKVLSGEYLYTAIEKLATYEDLEEQGLLVRLPCKVGDTVYVVLSVYCKSKYAEAHVRDYTYFTSCGFCVVVTSTKFDKQSIPFSEFGKTVFLTREEVEKNLEELKNEI